MTRAKSLARARSLAALRESHAGVSQQVYAKQSELTTGARSWVFGDLPERQEAGSGAGRRMGYPALVDEGGSVGLRIFATPAEARISHERGCARLIRLVMARDLKPLRRDLAVNVQGEIVYRGLAPHPLLNADLIAGRDLRDDLLDRIVMTVFLEDRETLRNAAAFDERIATLRGGMGLPAQEISRMVQAVLEKLGRIQTALAKAPPPAAADIRTQLAWLAPAGFLLTTPTGAVAGISALPAGDRAAAREGATRSAARRATRSRDCAAGIALPRACQGRARLEAAG
jgi:ATP-dependent helicase HrpA